MIYYKIRKKDTDAKEMFLKGTPTYHTFDKEGRVFQKIGGLRTFLTGLMKNKSIHRVHLSEIEIVEYELVFSAVKDLHLVLKPEKIFELLKR
jgi:hypothetical protein